MKQKKPKEPLPMTTTASNTVNLRDTFGAIVRVLLVDDHTLVRDGLRRLLEDEAGFEVVGQARDGREAVEMAISLQPDVIIMDIAMPSLGGIDATARIKKAKPSAKVIALSMFMDEEYIVQAIGAGASGYVMKDAPAAELIEAIRAVARGERYFDAQIPDATISRLKTEQPAAAGSKLTPREREVLQLLAEGHTVRQIGELLGLSRKTVDVHKTHLMKKLDIHNRVGVVRYAIQNKIIHVG